MPRPLIHRVSQFLQLAPGAHLMAFYSLYPLRNVMGQHSYPSCRLDIGGRHFFTGGNRERGAG